MITNKLVQSYRQAAIRHGIAIEQSKPRAANRAYRELAKALQEIRRRGPEIQSVFLELLEDESPWVRCWVATDSLGLVPEKALRVLGELAAGPNDDVRFEARMILKEWEAGRFKP